MGHSSPNERKSLWVAVSSESSEKRSDREGFREKVGAYRIEERLKRTLDGGRVAANASRYDDADRFEGEVLAAVARRPSRLIGSYETLHMVDARAAAPARLARVTALIIRPNPLRANLTVRREIQRALVF